jgi:hypothetical protein
VRFPSQLNLTHCRLRSLLTPALSHLFYTAIGYMQMTEAQTETYARDPNQWVSDEDDDTACNVRISASHLVQELVAKFKQEAVTPFVAALGKRLQVWISSHFVLPATTFILPFHSFTVPCPPLPTLLAILFSFTPLLASHFSSRRRVRDRTNMDGNWPKLPSTLLVSHHLDYGIRFPQLRIRKS